MPAVPTRDAGIGGSATIVEEGSAVGAGAFLSSLDSGSPMCLIHWASVIKGSTSLRDSLVESARISETHPKKSSTWLSIHPPTLLAPDY